MIATTIGQSKHLVELGLDPNTADCMWLVTSRARLHVLDGEPISNYDRWENYPAWSLTALLDVMRQANAVTTLQVTSLSTLMRCKDMGFIWQNDLYIYDPTTAAYEMVCYLLRNNLIPNN